MKLLFQNSKGEERLIAEVEDEPHAFKKIKEFCDERDFKIPYMRQWCEGDRLWFDVSSHSEFFILER